MQPPRLQDRHALRLRRLLQPRHLLLTQLTILILQPGQARILPHQHKAQQNQQTSRNCHQPHTRPNTRIIIRLLLIQVRIRRPDRHRITQRIDKRIRSSALSRRARQHASDPGENGAVHGHEEHHEEEGEVLGAEGGGVHEEDEACDGGDDGVEAEPESGLEAVGYDAVAVRPDGHEDVGWGDEEEGDEA